MVEFLRMIQAGTLCLYEILYFHDCVKIITLLSTQIQQNYYVFS